MGSAVIVGAEDPQSRQRVVHVDFDVEAMIDVLQVAVTSPMRLSRLLTASAAN